MMYPSASPSGAGFQTPGKGTSRSAPTSTGSRPIRKSRLRRKPKKPVPTHVLPLRKNASTVWFTAICCLFGVSIFPICILESIENPETHPRAVQSVHRIMAMAENIRQRVGEASASASFSASAVWQRTSSEPKVPPSHLATFEKDGVTDMAQEIRDQLRGPPVPEAKHHDSSFTNTVFHKKAPPYTVSDLTPDPESWRKRQPLARGIAGRPVEDTPALEGAERAHIQCDINVDSLAYWNDPVGQRDLHFTSPFKVPSASTEQYLSFAPDRGGWNNIRMSMEIMFVLAAAMGRTLVLPPKEPMYLLSKNVSRAQRRRSFGDFFPLHHPNFPVKVITMEEFVQREDGKVLKIPNIKRTEVFRAAPQCDPRPVTKGARGPDSAGSCKLLDEFLFEVGYNPGFSASQTCLLFDLDAFWGGSAAQASSMARDIVARHCGKRDVVYWTHDVARQHNHIHLPANQKQFRMLTHFYNMVFFSNPSIGHYFNRLVRDFLHYQDPIYCAAGKIVKALQKEGTERGFPVNPSDGGGGYSALHVRRGDLQYKRVKISALEWYNNTQELWKPKELLYVATDERNKTFFDDLARHYDLRFLDDYWKMAQLSDLDPNYMGMVDTIVASRGRLFVGTWFSTFSGYISRLRGYHGMSMKDTWYSFLPKKTAVHTWKDINTCVYAYEYPDGWIGIDADEWPSKTVF